MQFPSEVRRGGCATKRADGVRLFNVAKRPIDFREAHLIHGPQTGERSALARGSWINHPGASARWLSRRPSSSEEGSRLQNGLAQRGYSVAGEVFESCLHRVHTFVGGLHGLRNILAVCGNGRETAAHSEQHLLVGFMFRVPQNHLAEVANLGSQSFAVCKA